MKVQAKRALSLLLALVLTMGLTANAAQVSTQLDQTARYLHTTVKDPQVGSVGGEWAVLGLARSGYAVPLPAGAAGGRDRSKRRLQRPSAVCEQGLWSKLFPPKLSAYKSCCHRTELSFYYKCSARKGSISGA